MVGCSKPNEQALPTKPVASTPADSTTTVPAVTSPSAVITDACVKLNSLMEQSVSELEELSSLQDLIDDAKLHTVYIAPTYSGAFAFSGTYRASFKEGVVIEGSNGQLHLIEDVSCVNGFGGRCSPGTWFDGGYVELTGRTIVLNFGRNGTPAPILKSSDVETYREDQLTYQNNIAIAHQAAANAVIAYNDYRAKFASLTQKHQKTIGLILAQKSFCDK